MSSPARKEAALPDLGALGAMSDAVESGLGLPEVVRAAARALDASLVLIDRSSSVLAVAARSTADERSLMRDAEGVETHELRVGDAVVGRLRLRARGGAAVGGDAADRDDDDRVGGRAPARARPRVGGRPGRVPERALPAQGDRSRRHRRPRLGARRRPGRRRRRGRRARPPLRARRRRLARPRAGRRRARRPRRRAGLARRRARGPGDPQGHVVVLLPTAEDAGLRRVAEGIARELHASVHGFTFAVGHSRVAHDPVDLYRAGNEALLAANVATAAPASDDVAMLAFEDTGAYRLLLPAMSEDPAELQRFYEETVAPLVAYDDQYETDLVQTLETFLDADGNVAGTAARLFTHRHTVRYRLERVKDLTALDVASTDGREKLGLGLKAMRVLGIAAPRGPATEAGAGGGRVRREARIAS